MYAFCNNQRIYHPFRLCAIGLNKQFVTDGSAVPQFYELMIGRVGKAVIRIQDEQSFQLHPDQAVIVKPGHMLEFQALDEEWDAAVLRFYCSHSALNLFQLRHHQPLALRSSRRIMELIELLWREWGEEETVYSSSEIIFSLLLELKMQSNSLQYLQQYSVKMMQKVLDYIHENYAAKLTIDEISKRFGYTSQHFNRIFKKELGYTGCHHRDSPSNMRIDQ
ncbi:hypothetical protein QFZ77_006457 [Paenibacillus sp. V4I3]|uniref:AraC family transcriptional regulator n=2 Tax=unclassified Paenibacillus TaxID=185978 RepID=UPI002780383E|nr:AraC family transcriptional regulator [Paenibacillus sp. V4I3]MDQ0877798.1 hypothetical protein [Paenibacillus sp. V4I3]